MHVATPKELIHVVDKISSIETLKLHFQVCLQVRTNNPKIAKGPCFFFGYNFMSRGSVFLDQELAIIIYGFKDESTRPL
jgi:hypothetical protein